MLTGILNVSGGFTTTVSGTLRFVLGGVVAGTGFGKLQGGGNLAVFGGLELMLVNGFIPWVGAQFPIITSTGTRSGIFNSVAGQSLNVDVFLEPSYLANGVTIVALDAAARLAQTISFSVPTSVPATSTPITLTATSSSGLAVEFLVASGPAAIHGDQLTFTGSGTVTVRAVQAGNAQFLPVTVEQTVIVTSSLGHQVSGEVKYYAGTAKVPGVQMSLTGGQTLSAITGATGAFSFTLSAGADDALTPSKLEEIPPSQGVTTLDIALIRRHILGITALGSPFKLLAADVNGSASVTTLDIAFIRRLILGTSTTLPKGPWQFVPSDIVFPDPNAPWNPDPARHYVGLASDQTGQNFIDIRLGDVNNS